MNKFNRLIVQVALWLVIGLVIWFNQTLNTTWINENLVIFLFQVLLIYLLIFVLAPKLLFTKKYALFTIVSVCCVMVLAFIVTWFFKIPMEPHAINNMPAPGPPHDSGPRQPPSHYLFNVLILGISFSLALALEVFNHLKKKEAETIKAQNVNLENELKLLKSQINPHFLFNSLNNIYTLAGIDTGKTQKSIINLSDMLRYVLYDCEQEVVSIKKEIEYIENYLKLFALKSSKSYPISIKLNIENNGAYVAPMLFIPFIENALKHSNIDDRNNAFININITATSTEINFDVENSKPQNKVVKDGVGGIGLENVKKRLAILYPNKHSLKIVENETNFKINLQLKLI
ncbi:sensor histidine kinase [Tamlana sp. 62-3]|uniref:Sensor histidine kinase n=1 Tax=Neotamlana sargassicola TaxID=2883125 RepID=A0A9X1I5Y6_9FLAO|nr:histidine kinase [Tamlana sargassicola]MCB4808466.1 sensor histidine kinase [Tamlana sargassicola]